MNIFVSNINFKTTEEELGKLFAEYGEVTSSRIIINKYTHRSRGYGFVEMSEEDGKKAIEALNGKEFMGRTIAVAVSTAPRKEPGQAPQTPAV